MVYIVEITRISAFHGYMTCSTFFFFFFVSDDFTLSPLGAPGVLGTLDSKRVLTVFYKLLTGGDKSFSEKRTWVLKIIVRS